MYGICLMFDSMICHNIGNIMLVVRNLNLSDINRFRMCSTKYIQNRHLQNGSYLAWCVFSHVLIVFDICPIQFAHILPSLIVVDLIDFLLSIGLWYYRKKQHPSSNASTHNPMELWEFTLGVLTFRRNEKSIEFSIISRHGKSSSNSSFWMTTTRLSDASNTVLMSQKCNGQGHHWTWYWLVISNIPVSAY